VETLVSVVDFLLVDRDPPGGGCDDYIAVCDERSSWGAAPWGL
jgi:hypothetical protein